MSSALYDQIGNTYTSTRRPDPRIAALINAAIGDAKLIVNVGAGAGAYETNSEHLVAVEPSWQMIRQRPHGARPVVQAVAESLPFRSNAFDVALAVLTLHHWKNWRAGIAEMKRTAKRIVILAFDVDALEDFWLTAAYFPEIIAFDRARSPELDDVAQELGDCTVHPVVIPHDCIDGFLAAFWRRPETYLDPNVRASISSFALLDERTIARGVSRLAADLESAEWERQFGHVRALEAIDAGYRLLTTP